MKRIGSEEELAEKVVTYLIDLNWRVYQEVQVKGVSGRADIVATQGRLLWVVECKLSFGLDVIGQAYGWRGVANWTSIAVPPTNRGSMWSIGNRILRDYGVGLLLVGEAVHERVAPQLFRRAATSMIRDRLVPEHETFAKAGNARSDYWTPYQETCRAVHDFVKGRPACSIKELVDGIKHHYASAKSAQGCLLHWIDAGKVPGVRIVREGRAARVVLADTEEAA